MRIRFIGDQIEQEVGRDATDAAIFGLAHGAVLLALTQDAPIVARRDCDMPYLGCHVVRSSMALLLVLPVLVTAWICVTCGVTYTQHSIVAIS
jgi:hypothetical protein